TQFRLVDWFYGRGSEVLSLERFDDLLDIIRSKGFTPKDLEGFTARKAERLLEAWAEDDKIFHPENGWHESSVHIPMPCTKVTQTSESEVPTYEVRGLHHRNIVDLVAGCLSDKNSRFAHSYHWIPSKLYWDPPASETAKTSANPTPSSASSPQAGQPQGSAGIPPPPLRVYTDTFNSDAMNAEEDIIRKMPRVHSDPQDVEYAVLPVLLWSDETVLSSFGSAKLWPIYLYFGSLSKYIRGRPTEFAAHHLAYIPDVRPLIA
ncbi:hypothetical protein C8Q80DRAFT_1058399, partial [Daedaleopsis nitida]